MVKSIELACGLKALVDDDDYEIINGYNWFSSPGKYTDYAYSNIGGKKASLHRTILNAQKKMVVDHIDGDGLNNQKINLRISTVQENNRNKLRNKNMKGNLKGVFYVDRLGKYKALITENKKSKHLGCFKTEEEAGKAYDNAARKNFGEYARLNFPRKGEQSALHSEVKERQIRTPKEKRERRVKRTSSSRYKCVGFHKLTGKWTSYIGSKEKRRYLGLFATEEEANTARLKELGS